MTRIAITAIMAAGLLTGASAHAAQSPKPGFADPRIQTLNYDPDNLVLLHGELGFQMMLAFAPDEHIENVSIGDGLAWQITPNKRANLLFLKPLSPGIVTNMTVVTDQRQYAFELDAKKPAPVRRGARTYVVRFIYPAPPVVAAPPPPPPPAAPTRSNTRYSYTGSAALLPSLVFDDGRFTYFQWPQTTPTPAVFAVAGEGGEALVNFGVRDGYLVVEQVAPKFVLRNGQEVTTVLNDGWREPKPGPDAPRPHTAKSSAAPRGGDR